MVTAVTIRGIPMILAIANDQGDGIAVSYPRFFLLYFFLSQPYERLCPSPTKVL